MVVKSRGGPRKGAGRPAGSTTTDRTEKLMVRLTPEERTKAEAIGKGNASEGLRIALSASYNADRARNCEMLVDAMKARISILRIELRDALFMAYGAEMKNWPKTAKTALGEIEA